MSGDVSACAAYANQAIGGNMKKINNTFAFINRKGLCCFSRECYYRTIDNCFEAYFHVDTKGMISKEELGIDLTESVEYSSVSYRHIIHLLNMLHVDKTTSTLLDYGCGKGRVIISAAAYHYKKILGVELADIITVARDNIDRMKHRRTINVVFEQCDAKDFSVPSDVNIIYFFNPFTGSLLDNVASNIYSSYRKNPRKIYVIYLNNDHFDKVVSHQDWLNKTYQTEFHPNISCGLYETA